ncbi:hypothetical protein V490_08038 [Pseudogymnoascus sp. VKM F-3557]|nr:hypothetical protein V490_08038 [Pseudogymnoascus sp. VKM F-3557]
MLVSSRHEWIRSTLLNVSLLGKPTKSEEEKNHGSKPRKQFQARTSYRRDWERREQSYRQEKLIETVQRKRILELRSTFSDEVQRAMGILHVQSLLLQKLAREENKATEHSRANFESSLTEETNPQLATISDLQDLLRDVGSAVATLSAGLSRAVVFVEIELKADRYCSCCPICWSATTASPLQCDSFVTSGKDNPIIVPSGQNLGEEETDGIKWALNLSQLELSHSVGVAALLQSYRDDTYATLTLRDGGAVRRTSAKDADPHMDQHKAAH